jgi:hypothetical protein
LREEVDDRWFSLRDVDIENKQRWVVLKFGECDVRRLYKVCAKEGLGKVETFIDISNSIR